MTLNEMVDSTKRRITGFEMMIAHLQAIKNPVIVETGCAREENNFEGDGMSTIIFDTYIDQNGGEFYSVDLSEENVRFSQSKVKKGKVTCGDSINFLYELNKKFLASGKKIDLLYLDSYDFDESNPHPSALHHLMELTAITPSLAENCLVVVDDNIVEAEDEEGKRIRVTGKGVYILQYFQTLKIAPQFISYQFGWKL